MTEQALVRVSAKELKAKKASKEAEAAAAKDEAPTSERPAAEAPSVVTDVPVVVEVPVAAEAPRAVIAVAPKGNGGPSKKSAVDRAERTIPAVEREMLALVVQIGTRRANELLEELRRLAG